VSQEPSTTRPTFVRTAIVLAAAVLAALGGGYALAANTPSQVVSPPTSQSPSVLVGVTPVRVLDTRGAAGGPIGVPAAKKLGAGESIDVAVAGGGAVPANATSVAVNITIDEDATLKSFLTVWPTGETRPNTSANNAEPGLVSANSAIFQLGAGGKLSVFNQTGTVNVIMDVTGYFLACAPPSGGTTTTTTPGETTTTGATTTTSTTAPGATTAPDCTAPGGTTPTAPAPTLTAGALAVETGLAFTGTDWTGCSAITVTAIGAGGGSTTGITPLPDGSISGNVSLGATPTGNYLLVAQGTPSETCRAETTFIAPAA
jgi:hypothetical protein